MKVIVCGAGQVGFHIARYLAVDDNDVTVIDQSPHLVQKVDDSLDARGLLGFASHPDVLEEANAGEADMLIAVTQADEVNMVACQVAHSLFSVPKKIARIRSRRYLQPIWADLFTRDHLPIDHIISPELEVAASIRRRLQVPGAFEMIPLADDHVRVIGVHCGEDCPIINTPLRQLTALFPDLNIVIFGILRGDRAIVANENDQLLPGDEAYFVAETTHVRRAMDAFGHAEPEARRIIVFGAGNIGLALAEETEQHTPDVRMKLVELDRERAQQAAQALSRVAVLRGDALDPTMLDEANVHEADTVVAVSNDDKVNIVSSLLAKRMGAQRAITLVNENAYDSMIRSLGIDVVVSPRAISVSTILQHVRRGRIRQVHSLGDGFGEIIEAEALETSGLVGKPLREISLPQGVIVAALVRGRQVIMPHGGTTIHSGDKVVIFSASASVKKVERMLRVRPEFF